MKPDIRASNSTNSANSASSAKSYDKIYDQNAIRKPGVKSVLVVEDDPFSKKLFSKILTDRYDSIDLILCGTYKEAVNKLARNNNIDLIILDIFLGDDKLGVDFYLLVLELKKRPIVIMTSSLEISQYFKLFPEGVVPPPYLKKPFRPDSCADIVDFFTNGELI